MSTREKKRPVIQNTPAPRQDEILAALVDKPDQTAKSILDLYMPLYDVTRLRRKLHRMKDLGKVTRRRVLRPVDRTYTYRGKRRRYRQERLVDLWRAA